VSVTSNYSLPTGHQTDDIIQPDHVNRLADAMDRILWNFLAKLMADGALSGWEIQNDKTVSAGEGLIDGCWCSTSAAFSISGLTNGAVNYVFGQRSADSAWTGGVSFYASTNSTKPTGHIYLGTIELDANGDVVSIANDAEGPIET